MTDTQRMHAANVVTAIQGGYFEADYLPRDVQNLVFSLGGTKSIDTMSPGAVALYLVALMILQG